MKEYEFVNLASALGPFVPILILLLIGWIAGRSAERKHFQSLDERERGLAHIVVTDLKSFPGGADPTAGGELVMGEVVIATDYLKSFLASLRKILGGELKSYDSLLNRARREALVRVKETARSRGYNAVANLRLQTADIGGMTGAKGAVMVEMFAWGTAYTIPPQGGA